MRKFEEYAPCKNSMWGYHRQGFCQAGFSAALSQVNYLNNKKMKFIMRDGLINKKIKFNRVNNKECR